MKPALRRARRSAFFVPLAGVFLLVLPAWAGLLRVTSGLDDGPGSLREAILEANEAPGSTIEVELGDSGLIVLGRSLPPLTGADTTLNGGGVTLREGEGCERPGRKKGCDGLVVAGPRVTVRDIDVAGFTFDGVAVRGADASDVHIEDVSAIDNLDDGIGVSEGARGVRIERCLLMGNGHRTKGKGLLVFSEAEATLSASLVIGNRDGVTVTRGSSADLEDVFVVGNFDKGVGLSAGTVVGRRLSISANGLGDTGHGRAPNGDGLRVGLAGEARLEDSRIAANGDTGVVVLDTSRVHLDRVLIEGNRRPTAVEPTATLTRR